MSQREVWDTLAIDWAKFRSVPQEAVQEFLRDKNGLILDVGCGTGRNLLEGKRFVALDYSKNMLYIGNKKLVYRDDISFVEGDGVSLPFKDKSFNTVMAMSTVHTLYKKNHPEILKEINRVLKPGGYALITVWNKRQPRFWFKKKEAFVDWKIGEKKLSRYYYLYTKNEFKKILKNSGFEIVSIYGSKKKTFRIFSTDIIAIVRKK